MSSKRAGRYQTKPKYEWHDSRGVVAVDVKDRRNGDQILQLLNCGNKRFRIKCGKLLVEALNKECVK